MSSKFTTTNHATRFIMLTRMVKEGKISELQTYPDVKLGDAGIKYTPLFSYIDKKGQKIYEDFKERHGGLMFKMYKRLWSVWGVGKLQIMRKHGREFKMTQYVLPKNKEGEVDGNR